MTRPLVLLLFALLLQGCTEEPARQVHTSFSEASGLLVEDNLGLSQRLIPESRGVRAVISPDGRWIAVEDSKLSNLVVVRAFRYSGGRYEEIPLPGVRQKWEAVANEAGLDFEDLINPRVGIEAFGPGGKTLLLSFRADTGLADRPELQGQAEFLLEPAPE